MTYERPKLITLTGGAWKTAGQCASGGSNPDPAGCLTGIGARQGPCSTGAVPSASATCGYGPGAAGCNTGDSATSPGCTNGFSASGTSSCNGGLSAV